MGCESLGAIAKIQTGPFGSQLHKEDYVLEGTPIVTVEHLGMRRFTTQNLPYVSDEDVYRLNKYTLSSGDIVFSRVGSVDRCSYVSADEDGWMFSGRCLRVRGNPDEIDSLYLYYYFSLESTKQTIRSIAVGATMPSINTKILSEISIHYPPLPTQQKIAKILSSLDDKIELNNRMNANLEEQAQAIYREMFCSEGCCEDIGTLSQLISIKYGKDHKKLDDGIFPVYGSGGIMRYAERFLYDGETVLVPRKGTLNNVIYLNEPFWSVDTMFYTEMKQPNSAKFVYHFLKGKDLSSMNAGTAVPSMTTEILNGIQLYIPAQEKLDEFETIVSPIYRSLKRNVVETQHLAQLRDTLLPRLMHGEIDVESVV